MAFGNSLRTIRLGVRSLLLHKLRSFLTMLGILFGVSSVVAMLAIGEGASEKAMEEIRRLGSNNVIVSSQKPSEDETQNSQETRRSRAIIYGLKFSDQEIIERTIPGIERTVGVREIVKPCRSGARALELKLMGTTQDYLDVSRVEVAMGRFLETEDELEERNVAVIGAETQRELFPFENPIGKFVTVGGESFRVVGSLAPRGGASDKNFEGSDEDKVCIIPLSTMRARYGTIDYRRTAGSRSMEVIELHEIRARTASISAVPHIAQAIREILKRTHDKEDYEVTVPLELLRTEERTKRLWKTVLAAIAGISLLVGGIGVMNVMLATVTERTREIGIRRALGAKRRHIVSQFLVETLVLSTTGGAIGVLLGLGIPALVEKFTDMTTIVRWDAVILAFTISAMVGVVFGLYPAMRAAGMDPVEALRHE